MDDGLLQDYTLFAPNDQAFCRTAKNDLEYEGSCDPPDAEAVLEYYVALLILLAGFDEAALGEILVAILTYHAADGRMTVQDLRRKGYFTTYCQCFEIEVKKQTKKITKLIDAARKYPNIEFRQQNMAVKDDGIVHIVKSVLLPPLEEVIDPDPPTLDECPEGGGDDCFFAPFNPHICGDDYVCYYSTLCDVEGSGFDRDDDCCQQAGDDVVCIEEYNPVTCGAKECPYDNLCLAVGAGYDESQCTGEGSGGRCRGPAPDAECSKILEPVECGRRKYPCQYNNLCLAKSAGWAESQCRREEPEPEPRSCPQRFDIEMFNTNSPGCTFCARNDDQCQVACTASGLCLCGDDADLKECCAENPCCSPCIEDLDVNSDQYLECTMSSCFVEGPASCSAMVCP